MARPNKYNWNEIQNAYESGVSIDKLCLKYGVLKKTLENRISSQKWEIMGEVNSAINEVASSFGRVSGIKEKYPEKAHIIDEQIEEKTKHLQYINNLTLKNLSVMAKKINEDLSIQDHKYVAETVDKAAITLKVADRHAPKQDVNVIQTQVEDKTWQVNIIKPEDTE